MAYITAAELKTHLKITGTGDDTLLGMIAARAQKIIDAEAGWPFEATAATRYYDPTVDTEDGVTLDLDYPLLSITTLTNGDSAVVTASQYVLRPANDLPKWQIRLRGSVGLSWTYTDDPENAIIVAGTWGYATSAPIDIVQAALMLGAYLYNQRSFGSLDVPGTPGPDMVPIDFSIPRLVHSILDPYRRRL